MRFAGAIADPAVPDTEVELVVPSDREDDLLAALRPPRPWLRPKLLLGLIVLIAAVYHAWQSQTHATPAIFTDELLFEKLAQSLAAGDGLAVRGEPYFFPSFLASLVQAPLWLFDDVPTAYGLVKAFQALLMASAAVPAYWLARQLARPSLALVAAAGTVASPALVYHSFLMSEALAYPVFLLACATAVRALVSPSLGAQLALLGVSVLAVGSRVQLVLVPLAYALLTLLLRRRELRRHAVALLGLGLAGAGAALSGGAALGPYLGGLLLDYEPLDVLRYGGLTGMLLPLALGWVVFPGAVLGLVDLARSPRAPADRPFASLTLAVGGGALLLCGLVAAADAQRVLERYAIYTVPLLLCSFAAYVERGAPWRRAHAVVAVVLALPVPLVPLVTYADVIFSFDSPTLSAYSALAWLTGHADAQTVFVVATLLLSILVAALHPRGRAGVATAWLSVAVLLATGAAVYLGDHERSRRNLAAWAGSPPDWLDRLGATDATFLELPGGSPHFGWMLEAWNRGVTRSARFGGKAFFNDSFPTLRAAIAPDGRLLLDGRQAKPGIVVANDYGSRLELDGARLLTRPGPGLTAYEVSGTTRVYSLATGLYADHWARTRLRFQVWPDDPEDGVYRLRLALPREFDEQRVAIRVGGVLRSRVLVRPGATVSLAVAVEARGLTLLPRLELESSGFALVDQGTPNVRFVGVRVLELAYAPGLASGLAGNVAGIECCWSNH